MPHPRPRTLLGVLVLVAGLGGAWLWLRDSSLVAVQRVSVAGAGGPDAAHIRAALTTAARNMTTLDVKMEQLRNAVAPYPVVKSLDVDTQFPHGMRIRVIEQVPVAVVNAGGRRMAVAGDGTLLHDVVASSSLPTITLGIPPGGTRLTGYALSEARLLAAAPYQLLGMLSQVSDGPAHGLAAQLRSGPSVYFGDSSRLAAKWTAAAEVLADTRSAGAAYVDVTDPSRPVAGSGSDSNGASGPAAGTANRVAGTAAPNAATAGQTAGAASSGNAEARPTPSDGSSTAGSTSTAPTGAAGGG